MKSSLQLLADANSASNKISKLKGQKDKVNEKHDKVKQKIWSDENDEKNQLDKKYRTQRTKADDENEKTVKDFDNSIDSLYNSVSDVEKIIYFLRSVNNENTFDASEIKAYQKYGQKGDVSRLYAHNEEFLQLSYVMYETDRPKNKFALCIIGQSNFGSHDSSDLEGRILDLPYSYGCHLQKDGNANIMKLVKHLPTKEDVKEYAKNNPIEKVLKNFLAKFETVKKEALESKKNYDLKDFEEYRLEKTRKYFENNSRLVEYYAERFGIKKDSWVKMNLTEKRKIMENL